MKGCIFCFIKCVMQVLEAILLLRVVVRGAGNKDRSLGERDPFQMPRWKSSCLRSFNFGTLGGPFDMLSNVCGILCVCVCVSLF